jgi:hypothetical protein
MIDQRFVRSLAIHTALRAVAVIFALAVLAPHAGAAVDSKSLLERTIIESKNPSVEPLPQLKDVDPSATRMPMGARKEIYDNWTLR